MKCPKCEGLLVMDRSADYYLTCYGLKCLNCGTIVNQTMIHNGDVVERTEVEKKGGRVRRG